MAYYAYAGSTSGSGVVFTAVTPDVSQPKDILSQEGSHAGTRLRQRLDIIFGMRG